MRWWEREHTQSELGAKTAQLASEEIKFFGFFFLFLFVSASFIARKHSEEKIRRFRADCRDFVSDSLLGEKKMLIQFLPRGSPYLKKKSFLKLRDNASGSKRTSLSSVTSPTNISMQMDEHLGLILKLEPCLKNFTKLSARRKLFSLSLSLQCQFGSQNYVNLLKNVSSLLSITPVP